jgi:hypothetical protein
MNIDILNKFKEIGGNDSKLTSGCRARALLKQIKMHTMIPMEFILGVPQLYVVAKL